MQGFLVRFLRPKDICIHLDAAKEHGTNVASLPVGLATHHAVWSWQGGYICAVFLRGVEMYTDVRRPLVYIHLLPLLPTPHTMFKRLYSTKICIIFIFIIMTPTALYIIPFCMKLMKNIRECLAGDCVMVVIWHLSTGSRWKAPRTLATRWKAPGLKPKQTFHRGAFVRGLLTCYPFNQTSEISYRSFILIYRIFIINYDLQFSIMYVSIHQLL